MSSLSLLFSNRTLKGTFLALLLSLALPFVPSLSAQEAAQAPKRELSEKVSEALGEVRKLSEEKKLDEAVAKLTELYNNAAPNSYDRAILSQFKAQTLLQKEAYSAAIEPLETALKLSDANGFFDKKVATEVVYYLAQLYYQDALSVKGAEAQSKNYAKATSYIRRWLQETEKPDTEKSDAQLFLASMLFNQAQINPEKIDLAMVKQAGEEAQKGLYLNIKPKEQFFVLLLASYQQESKLAESAEILELLVKDYPKNKGYWQSLASTYLSLEKFVDAVITIERAQKEGALNSNKDNLNLAGIYFNIQQYDFAAQLLEDGLKNGTVDNEQRNWETLAAAYQQIRKELKAIDTLQRASKVFPKSGSLDLQIGQIYYNLDDFNNSYKYIESATKKGLEKNSVQAYTFLAYLGMELKRFDDALVAAKKAIELDPNAREPKRLFESIQDIIKEREAYKNSKSK